MHIFTTHASCCVLCLSYVGPYGTYMMAGYYGVGSRMASIIMRVPSSGCVIRKLNYKEDPQNMMQLVLT